VVQIGEVIPIAGTPPPDAYLRHRERLTDILVRYCLLDSYRTFVRHHVPYPFFPPDHLLPNTAMGKIEQPYQNTALIFMLDGGLPRGLNKHFRLRGSNRVTWRNIQRLAPDTDLIEYKSAHCDLASEEVGGLIRNLSRLDYALMIERQDDDDDDPEFRLSHMHVKVERLTDNAIKDLAKSLGYVDRRLFERGEDYVDALEIKFFEYFGFSANASGRKSAAAMAAQLLAGYDQRFAVFVSSQEDCRLTCLDDSELVTQYLLLRLDGDDEERFLLRCKSMERDPAGHVVHRDSAGKQPIVVLRVRYRRTLPALGTQDGKVERSLQEPWLEIAEQAILGAPDSGCAPLPFAWCETGLSEP
jgi:hypothetical protein